VSKVKMPSDMRYCCFPKCSTKDLNGHRGRRISGRRKIGVSPFLYSLLKDYNGKDFAYSETDEVCCKCEATVLCLN